MKKSIVTLILIPFLHFGFSQTWVKYLENQQDMSANDTGIMTDDGGILLSVTFNSTNGAYKNGILKINQNGNQEWLFDKLGRSHNLTGHQYYQNGKERFAFCYKSTVDSRTQKTGIGLSVLDDSGERLKVWRYKNTDKMTPDNLFMEDDELNISIISGNDYYNVNRAFIHTDLNGKETGYSEQNLSKDLDIPTKQLIKNISLELLYTPIKTAEGMQLAKVENNKKVLWSTSPCVGVDSCKIKKILELKKERFISSKANWSIDIIKQDRKGNVLWTNNLPDAYTLCHWLRLDNGDLIVATMDTPRHSGKKSRLTKFSTSGEQLWQRIYTTENTSQISGFYQTADGGFLIVGHEKDKRDGKTKGLLIKTDEMGQTQKMDGNYEVVMIK